MTRRPFPCPPEQNFYAWPELAATFETKASLALRELDLEVNPATHQPASKVHTPALRSLFTAMCRPRSPKRALWWSKATAWCSSRNRPGELERLADIFQEYAVPFQLGLDPADATRPYLAERSYVAGETASTLLVKGLVRRGVVFPEPRIAVFGSEDLFDPSDLIAKSGPSKSQMAAFTADMADLKPGDYVVHVTHGIGKFLGTREITQGENKGDFMLLEYADEAKLYVPLTRMDLIQKYRGAGEGATPRARPAGRGHLVANQIARQSQDARYGR